MPRAGCKGLPVTLRDGSFYPPLSVIETHRGCTMADVLRELILYHFPRARSLYDPTCGVENIQFAKYLRREGGKWVLYDRLEYIASDIKATRWNCEDPDRLESCRIVNVLKPLPLPDDAFDVVVYDPPFSLNASEDARGSVYATSSLQHLLQVKRYYAENVIRELVRVARVGVVIRGMDLHGETDAMDVNLFIGDILDLDALRRVAHVPAVYIVVYGTAHLGRVRYRIGRAMRSKYVRRNIIKHSYIVVAYKKH